MKRSRTADFTIQGFLYQFNKTLLEILNSDMGSTVTIEGPIEDIEIESKGKVNAIQCKYHESSNKFTLSSAYKPVLQMMEHFQDNQKRKIHYKLYAYFKGESPSEKSITVSDLEETLKTKDKQLIKYVKKLKNKIDLKKFISRFSLETGDSLETVLEKVHKALESNGFSKDEIPILIYPNAINLISMFSIEHDVLKRRLTRKQLIKTLKELKSTAISKWTLSLTNFSKLLEKRREQLKSNLNKNSRSRAFILGSPLENLSNQTVPFIQEYLEKYHYKACHVSTPLFCIVCTDVELDDLQNRLYKKGIKAITGKIGTKFEKDEFVREPMIKTKRGSEKLEREAHIRLLNYGRVDEVFSDYSCDDLFVSEVNLKPKNISKDVLVEVISVPTFQNLKYVLGMTNAKE